MGNSISKEDMEFLEGVFNKAQYLQHKKNEEEIILKYHKKMKVRTIIILASLILVIALTLVIERATNYNLGVLFVLSIIVLALGCFIDYREERVKYEY